MIISLIILIVSVFLASNVGYLHSDVNKKAIINHTVTMQSESGRLMRINMFDNAKYKELSLNIKVLREIEYDCGEAFAEPCVVIFYAPLLKSKE
jgi:hypothetical protein